MRWLSKSYLLVLFFLSCHIHAKDIPQPPPTTIVESSPGAYNMTWGSQSCSVGPGGAYAELCDVQSYVGLTKQNFNGPCYTANYDGNCYELALQMVQEKGSAGTCDPRTTKCSASIPAASLTNYVPPEQLPLQSSNLYICAIASDSWIGSGMQNEDKFYFSCLPFKASPKCSASDIEFDFGNVSVEEFNGKSLTKDLMVTCTQDANVYITIAQPNISLSNGGQADVNVEHSSSNDAGFIPSSISTGIKTTVKLSGNVEPGSFNGSTTVIVNVL